MATLRPDERQFVTEYLHPANEFNATQAYLKVKPSVSKASAQAVSSKWLNKPHIKEEIQKRQEKKIINSIASKDYLIKEAHEIGLEARKQNKLNTALTAVDTKAKLNQVYQQETSGNDDYANLLTKLVVVQGNVNIQNNTTINNDKNQDDELFETIDEAEVVER